MASRDSSASCASESKRKWFGLQDPTKRLTLIRRQEELEDELGRNEEEEKEEGQGQGHPQLIEENLYYDGAW